MTPDYVFYTLLGVGLILIVVRKGDIVLSFRAPKITLFVGAKEKDREVRSRERKNAKSVPALGPSPHHGGAPQSHGSKRAQP